MKKELRYPEAQCDMSVSVSTESDLRISVAKLREVLEKLKGNLLNYVVIDEIINRVKKEL